MESQPQNPEFRNTPETFTHGDIFTVCGVKGFTTLKNVQNDICAILHVSYFVSDVIVMLKGRHHHMSHLSIIQ